jgi:hypothetical protein
MDYIKYRFAIKHPHVAMTKEEMDGDFNKRFYIQDLARADKLKNNEKKYGFSEAILSKKTNEKIPFFFLGPDNDWKKILPEDMKTRLNQIYEKNLKELSYI